MCGGIGKTAQQHASSISQKSVSDTDTKESNECAFTRAVATSSCETRTQRRLSPLACDAGSAADIEGVCRTLIEQNKGHYV